MAKAPRQVRKTPATSKPAPSAASTPANAILAAPAAPPEPTATAETQSAPPEQTPAAQPVAPAEMAAPAEPAHAAKARSERVWMKMTTGLSGPDISLSPGQYHRFDVAEAERLEQAGFAELSDGPEA